MGAAALSLVMRVANKQKRTPTPDPEAGGMPTCERKSRCHDVLKWRGESEEGWGAGRRRRGRGKDGRGCGRTEEAEGGSSRLRRHSPGASRHCGADAPPRIALSLGVCVCLSVCLSVRLGSRAPPGSTLEAMAKAVEDSAAVLVCVSKRYKESQACRTEAEYAFQ